MKLLKLNFLMKVWKIPTVKKFLGVFSLSNGSIIAFFCIFVRSLFFVVFYVVTILKLRDTMAGDFSFAKHHPEGEPFIEGDYVRYMCMIYIFILLSEFQILSHTIYLGVGLYTKRAFLIKLYLVNHMTSWSIQNIFFSLLTLRGKPPMGLNSCMINAVLESYYILVIYNYYTKLMTKESQKPYSQVLAEKTRLLESGVWMERTD